MAKIKITQIKSTIKRPVDQKRAIEALGLGKLNRTKEFEVNPSVMGNINKVKHLLKVEEI
jgi:large subunit ribosomal protein L30